MRRRPGLGTLGAGLALFAFVAFRIAIEAGIRGDGRHPTGMLSEDSYYPLAFARELSREGSWLLFHNPYGTLDRSAGLFDGLALVLRPLAPIWEHHLFAFDIAVGLVSAVAAGWCVGRLCALFSRQARAVTVAALVLLVCGTGVAFLTHAAGLTHNRTGLEWGTWWGVSWVANQLATWELLYHALFWAGALAIVRLRAGWAWAVGAVLAFLHPFTFAIYVLFAGAIWLAHRVRGHESTGAYTRLLIPLVAGALAVGLVFEVLLPAWSADADFIHRAYTVQPFAIPTGWLALFIAPALLFVVLLVAVRDGGEDREPPWAMAMFTFAGVLFLIAISRHVTHAIPQPAHWTRVYLIAALVLGALALPPARARHLRLATAAAMLIAAIAVADTVAGIGPIRRDIKTFGAPAVLDDSQRAVVDELKGRPTRLVVYLRNCDRRQYLAPLEYSVSALTSQRVLYGHVYFSPSLQARASRYAACPGQPRPPIPRGTYVLADPGVARSLPLREKKILGAYDFGVLASP